MRIRKNLSIEKNIVYFSKRKKEKILWNFLFIHRRTTKIMSIDFLKNIIRGYFAYLVFYGRKFSKFNHV